MEGDNDFYNDPQIRQIALDKGVERERREARKDDIEAQAFYSMTWEELERGLKEESDKLYKNGEPETEITSDEAVIQGGLIEKWMKPNDAYKGIDQLVVPLLDRREAGDTATRRVEIVFDRRMLDTLECARASGRLASGKLNTYTFIDGETKKMIESARSGLWLKVEQFLRPKWVKQTMKREKDKITVGSIQAFSMNFVRELVGSKASIETVSMHDEAILYILHSIADGVFVVFVYEACNAVQPISHYQWMGYYYLCGSEEPHPCPGRSCDN
jgi:hypothetical protein